MAALTAAMVPGPISIMAISTGIAGHRIGILSGGIGNAVASTVQVVGAYIIVVYAASYLTPIVKTIAIVGGFYLLYMSYSLLRSNPFYQPNEGVGALVSKNHDFSKTMLSAFLITLTNPKAIIFFVALFPQLVLGGVNTQIDYQTLIVLVIIISSIAMITFAVNSIFGLALRTMVSNTWFAVSVNVIFSIVLATIGLLSISSGL